MWTSNSSECGTFFKANLTRFSTSPEGYLELFLTIKWMSSWLLFQLRLLCRNARACELIWNFFDKALMNPQSIPEISNSEQSQAGLTVFWFQLGKGNAYKNSRADNSHSELTLRSQIWRCAENWLHHAGLTVAFACATWPRQKVWPKEWEYRNAQPAGRKVKSAVLSRVAACL